MPRKKETAVSAVAVEPRSKRQIKPIDRDDFVYESPAIKRNKKVEEENAEPVIQKKVEEKKVEKKTAVAEKEIDEEVIDPLFLEPFKFGWKREVVYPSNGDEKKIEVVYYTKKGKKLKTMGDISANLSDGLTLKNFTKMKKSITDNEEHEIKRKAVEKRKKAEKGDEKPKKVLKPNPEVEKTPQLPVLTLVENRTKRIITPKYPKGASPPPQSTPSTPISAKPSNSKKPEKKEVKENGLKAEDAKEQAVSKVERKIKETLTTSDNWAQEADHNVVKVRRKVKEVVTSEPPEVERKAKEVPEKAQKTVKNDVKPKEVPEKAETTVKEAANEKRIRKPRTASTKPEHLEAETAKNKPAKVPEKKQEKPAKVPKVDEKVKEVAAKKDVAVEVAAKEIAPKRVVAKKDTSMEVVAKVTASKKVATKEEEKPAKEATKPKKKADAVAIIETSNKQDLFGEAAQSYVFLLKVFEYLSVFDLCRASTVCHMWNQISCNERLWRQLDLKNRNIHNVETFIKFLQNRNIKSVKFDKVRMDHYSDRIPKFSMRIEDLEITNCKNKVCEILLKQNLRDLTLLKLKNIQGDCDFSQMGDLSNLEVLELSQINFKPQTLSAKKFESIKTLSVSNLTNPDVYEEISKLSQTLLELKLDRVHNRQLISTFLLSFDNLTTLTLQNIENYTNELLQTAKQMRNLEKMSLINFQVYYNFDFYLSQCSNLTDLVLEPDLSSPAAKPQVVNFLVVFGMLKLKLKSLKWIIQSPQKTNHKISFHRASISDNLKEIARHLFMHAEEDLTDDAKLEETKKIFKYEETGKDDITIGYQEFQKNLKKWMKKTVIEICV